eukprot:scaffold671_cov186-Ochromonas_danica.AAC.4
MPSRNFSALIAQSVEHSAVTQPPQRCTGYRKVERSRLSWSESFAICDLLATRSTVSTVSVWFCDHLNF